MAYYGVIFPEFWTGRTGRALREQGGKDAQILALYLVSNRHTNMIGLYHLELDDVRHETGLGAKAIDRGVSACAAVDFAHYDPAAGFVWVVQMAMFRLGLSRGERLSASDLKVKGVERLYRGLSDNLFLGRFFDHYRETLRLSKPRRPQGIEADTTTGRPLQGASEGLTSQYQYQDQKQDQKDPPTPHADARGAVRLTRAVRKRCEDIRRVRMGCRHEPRCASVDACLLAIAAELRSAVAS
jgi:hypothetical protein